MRRCAATVSQSRVNDESDSTQSSWMAVQGLYVVQTLHKHTEACRAAWQQSCTPGLNRHFAAERPFVSTCSHRGTSTITQQRFDGTAHIHSPGCSQCILSVSFLVLLVLRGVAQHLHSAFAISGYPFQPATEAFPLPDRSFSAVGGRQAHETRER